MARTIKNKENDLIFYVISNMDATLDAQNVAIINATTELHYSVSDIVSYQVLHDDRHETMGGNHCGMTKHKNGVEFWVLPSPKLGFVIKEDNTDIVEYSYNEYVGLVWDTKEIEL